MPRPLIVEDVLLLLLHDEVGPPTTAAMLLHALGGAVLVDLALLGRIGADGPTVVALGDGPLPDTLLFAAHATVARRPRPVRSLVPELGADLWRPVNDRLVERGRIRRERTRTLGLLPVTTRPVPDPRHEAALRTRLRAAQESGGHTDVRTAAVLALLSATGALPALRRAPVAAVAGPALDGDQAVDVIAAAVHATRTAAAALTTTAATPCSR